MDSAIRQEVEHLSFCLRKISLGLRGLFPSIVNAQQNIIYLATLYVNFALHSLSDFTEDCFKT